MIKENYVINEIIYYEDEQINMIVYDFLENREQMEYNLLTAKQDITKNHRHYQLVVNRNEYDRLAEEYRPIVARLSFNDFIRILRPIMMGTYRGNELEEAFKLLDRDQSGTIEIDELAYFLPIVQSHITKERLLKYIGKVDSNVDQKLSLAEFRDMVLRGIGRDMVTGNM